MNTVSNIVLFAGRLHPMVVHLPIGLLVGLAALEAASCIPRYRHAKSSAGLMLAFIAPTACMAVCTGWLLSLSGGYDTVLLDQHRWAGIATATGALTCTGLYWRRCFKLYRATLIVTVTMLMIAGHLGGTLTHGADYLSRYAPQPLKNLLGIPDPVKSGSDPAFSAYILSLLQAKCAECHGATKSKAGLRLDSISGVMAGGESGDAVIPGDILRSRLLQRILLPMEHEDHMPPEGKPQVTQDEVALLKWWIESGAPDDKTVEKLQLPPEIKTLINRMAAAP